MSEPSAHFSPDVKTGVARVREREPELAAFVRTRLEGALSDDERLAGTEAKSTLHRVPYGLKDVWDTAGTPTTGGSYRYRDRVPEKSSPVHTLFEEAGAVLLGKTNLSDLALSPESASYVGGVCKNPHDPARTAGGSSGGAAAAVADGMVAFDWGSDIGGSIRMPAAFCGVFGLRLSSETWPMVGHFPHPPPSLAWMNGQGPIARTIPAIRELLRITAPRLRTGASRPFRLRGAMLYGAERGRGGEWPTFAADAERAVSEAAGELRHDHGLRALHRMRNVAGAIWASHFDDLLGSDTLTLGEGLAAVLSALAFGDRFGDKRFHPRTAEVLILVALGRATIYRKKGPALRDVAAYQSDVASLWDRGYLVAAPTCLYPAPRHGGFFKNWDLTSCVMPGNLVDATGLAIPFGRFPNGMPRSLQLWGPPGSEEAVLEVGERIAAKAPPGPGPR